MTLSNDNHATAKRARGKIGELMNKNKIVAHQEVADLAKSSAADIKKTRSYMAKLRKQAAKDLTAATEGLYLNLNKAIARAVALGEAKSKEVLEHSTSNIDAVQRALSQEIAEQVEAMSDTLLKTLHGNRKKIAQNYLSVKGYTAAASGSISDMIQKGGLTKNHLSAIGDFLFSVSQGAAIKTKPAEGVAAGAGALIATFSGDIVPEVPEINKVNGLVDEYMEIYTSCQMRWPYGLGKYLLAKLSHAMTKDGVLTVGAKEGKSGQWVYLSGKASAFPPRWTTSPPLVLVSTTTRMLWPSCRPSSPR